MKKLDSPHKRQIAPDGPISWGSRSASARASSPSEAAIANSNIDRVETPVQSVGHVAALGLLGAALYLVAFLQSTIGFVGFLAIAPWAWLVIDARHIRLIGYVVLYGCGFLLWFGFKVLAAGSGVSSINIADLALIAYLAVYLPLFVSLGRLGREWLRLPIAIWLPIVWVGLACIKANLFGGFALGSLSHAVAYLPNVVQIADVIGSYGLSTLMVVTGATVVQLMWTFRRMKFLERTLSPSSEPNPSESVSHEKAIEAVTDVNDDRAFTTASRFRPRVQPVGQLRSLSKPTLDSQQSMKLAVRRNRDVARDHDLAMAVFSTFGVTALIVWSAWYSQYRVSEAIKWKLFEGYSYIVHAVGGTVNSEAFQAALDKSTSRGLVVYASSDSSKVFSGDVARSVLGISPQSNNSVVSDDQSAIETADQRWIATLKRFSGQFAKHDLGRSLGNRRWVTMLRPLAAIPVAFARDDEDVKIRILPILAYGSTIEQSMNDSLHAYVEYGKSIDVAVVVLEPSPLDGARWPLLTSRAVIVAAASNRCPVIAVIPDHDSFIAAGDGSIYEASDVGTSKSDVVSFSAMIDPRSSLYTATGEWPAWMAISCCVAVILLKVGATCMSFVSNARSVAATGKAVYQVTEDGGSPNQKTIDKTQTVELLDSTELSP